MMNIIDMQNNLKGLTDEQLVGQMQSPTGQVPQYLVLAELTRRKDMRDEFAKRQADSGKTVAENAIAAAGFPQGGIASMSGMAPRTDLSMNDAAPMMGQPPQPAPPPPTAEVRGMADGGIVDMSAPKWYSSGRSVAPRPQFSPFAMMEWDKKYGATHNTDGTPINPIWPTEDRPRARQVALPPMTFGNFRADDRTPSVFLPREELPMNFMEATAQQMRQPPDALVGYMGSRDAPPFIPADAMDNQYLLPAVDAPLRGIQKAVPGGVDFDATRDVAPFVADDAVDNRFNLPMMEETVDPLLDPRRIPPKRIAAEPNGDQPYVPNLGIGPLFSEQFSPVEGVVDPSGPALIPPEPEPLDARTAWERVVEAQRGQALTEEQMQNRAALDAMLARLDPEAYPVGDEVTDGTPAPVPPVVSGGGTGGGSGGGGGGSGSASGFSSYEQFIQKRLDDLARQKDKDKWLALAMAGAQLMASDNPSFGGAIGEAFQTGLGAYKDLMTKADEEEMDLMMKRLQLSAAAHGGGSGGGASSAKSGIPASLLDDYLRNQFSLEDDIRKINSDIVAGGMTDDTGYWVPYTEEQLAAKTRQRDYLTRTLEAAKLRSGSTDFYATE